jgi:hypothetical protein
MDISIRHVSCIVPNGNCGLLNGARKIDANLKRHYRMVDPCAKHFDKVLSKHFINVPQNALKALVIPRLPA